MLGHARRTPDDITHARHERAALRYRPQPQIPQTSTLDESSAHELFESALDGMGVSPDPSSDLPGVQFSARSAHQETQDLSRDPTATDQAG